MKVSGFSFIRNAVRFDYPVVESITSVLPICDEFVIAVGDSTDDTLQLIQSIESPKIKIIETIWDESLREGGRVLALETNKAFREISKDTDWAFYIQGDEVLHEKYLSRVEEAMEKWLNNQEVEGLLFNYLHFYGSYDYVGDSRNWYRKEVRVVRNDPNTQSFRDAQGFRKSGKSLQVKQVPATMYHYGWVKPPKQQQAKLETFHSYWHDDQWLKENIPEVDEFDYSQIDSLKLFTEDHPKIMRNRIKQKNWEFSFDPTLKKFSAKSRILPALDKILGFRIGEYKNYKLLK